MPDPVFPDDAIDQVRFLKDRPKGMTLAEAKRQWDVEHPKPEPQPPTRDLLLADIDELIEAMTRSLDAVKAITDQLEPDRARSCGNAVAMAAIMLDEVKLRAHAQPMTGVDRALDGLEEAVDRIDEAAFNRVHPPATCPTCGDILNAVDMPEHRQQVHGDT